MRLYLLLCAGLLLVPRIGLAEPGIELVESFPSGSVNWSKGVLVARGTFTPERSATPAEVNPEHNIAMAQQQAVRNTLRTLQAVRLDSGRRIAQLMAADAQIDARVREMAAAARVIEIQPLTIGAVRVAVQLELLGGFAQLVLPSDIKQVESIIQMPAPGRGTPAGTRPSALPVPPAADGFSGLIVDARGIGAKPALVPLLLDENGKVVYGPAFISREFAVQHGVCEYERSLEVAARRERVASHPLTIKGLRTLQGRECDIVISNVDADRLRDASANLGFLKQCRVIIVMD